MAMSGIETEPPEEEKISRVRVVSCRVRPRFRSRRVSESHASARVPAYIPIAEVCAIASPYGQVCGAYP